MKTGKFYLISIGITLLSSAATLVLLWRLPDTVATRWNQEGDVISSGSRYLLLLTALLPLAAIYLVRSTPSVDPSGKSFRKHAYAYSITMGFFLLFLIGIHWLIMLFNLGTHIQTESIVKVLIATALFSTGWVVPRIRFNHSVGIRTPWSIADETVWRKTHQAGGYLFYVAGVLFIVSSFFTGRAAFWIGAAALILVVCMIYLYSYLLSKKHQGS